jgi:hypothetical protein
VALTPLVTPGRLPRINAVTTSPDGRIRAVGSSSDSRQTSQTPIGDGISEPLVLVNTS